MNIINNGNSFLLLKYRLTFAAGIKNKIDVMNAIIGKKKLTVSNPFLVYFPINEQYRFLSFSFLDGSY